MINSLYSMVSNLAFGSNSQKEKLEEWKDNKSVLQENPIQQHLRLKSDAWVKHGESHSEDQLFTEEKPRLKIKDWERNSEFCLCNQQ